MSLDLRDLKVQVVLSFLTGLAFGGFAKSILFNFLFIIIYEIGVYFFTLNYPPCSKVLDRILINLVFFLGWTLSHIYFLGNNGFEECVDWFDNTKPLMLNEYINKDYNKCYYKEKCQCDVCVKYRKTEFLFK